jgi:hypothetical protein
MERDFLFMASIEKPMLEYVMNFEKPCLNFMKFKITPLFFFPFFFPPYPPLGFTA